VGGDVHNLRRREIAFHLEVLQKLVSLPRLVVILQDGRDVTRQLIGGKVFRRDKA